MTIYNIIYNFSVSTILPSSHLQHAWHHGCIGSKCGVLGVGGFCFFELPNLPQMTQMVKVLSKPREKKQGQAQAQNAKPFREVDLALTIALRLITIGKKPPPREVMERMLQEPKWQEYIRESQAAARSQSQ